jgi:hypothetical protein
MPHLLGTGLYEYIVQPEHIPWQAVEMLVSNFGTFSRFDYCDPPASVPALDRGRFSA